MWRSIGFFLTTRVLLSPQSVSKVTPLPSSYNSQDDYCYVQCTSHCFPIFNVLIDWRFSRHVRKILFYLLSRLEINMTYSLSESLKNMLYYARQARTSSCSLYMNVGHRRWSFYVEDLNMFKIFIFKIRKYLQSEIRQNVWSNWSCLPTIGGTMNSPSSSSIYSTSSRCLRCQSS